MSDNPFETLAAINVGRHVEKKGNLSYLSWAWAVDQLLRADHTANWEYDAPVIYPDGTMMVFCTVTAFGIPRKMQLPVMDHRNKPIANPDAFAINTAMQRCLVKAIALHGLGLYIYAGEDVPAVEKEQQQSEAYAAALVSLQVAAGNGMDALKEAWESLTPELRDELKGELPTLKAKAKGEQV